MDDAFAAQNVGGFAEVVAHIGLAADPIEVTADAGREIDLWPITSRANALGAAGEVAHFSWEKVTVRFRRDLNAERIGNLLGNFADWDAATTPAIHWQAVEVVGRGREQIGARDVVDEAEISWVDSSLL